MPGPMEEEPLPFLRWIAGEIGEDDPELEQLLQREPELRARGLELLGTGVQLDALAKLDAAGWEDDEVEREVLSGDALLMRRAAASAELHVPPPASGDAPSKRSWAHRARWALAAAAALFVVIAAWQPWSETVVEPRRYLSGPLAESPVGPVPSFELFSLREVPERARVHIVVYDSNDAKLAEWRGRGPEWSPSKEERAAMRAAGEIRWDYRAEDSVAGLRSGQAQAVYQGPDGTD